MSQVSDTEVARWALDADDWLWGTVQSGLPISHRQRQQCAFQRWPA